jgi:4-hydroxy-3-polyprenylbenzoate decarboxylase
VRLVVGITGATGAILGIRLLEALRDAEVDTHLVLSKWARATIVEETGWTVPEVEALAGTAHPFGDQAASISSGSFRTDGMVVVPCSMKTLAQIRHGIADGLVARAADVTIKEDRRLVLVPRETPLSEIHLENMLALRRAGVRIVPPMPAFYNHPAAVDDVVDHVVARICDQFDLPAPRARRWTGGSARQRRSA